MKERMEIHYAEKSGHMKTRSGNGKDRGTKKGKLLKVNVDFKVAGG